MINGPTYILGHESPRQTLKLSSNLTKGVDGCDTIDSKGRSPMLWATLGWKMNIGHWNRCFKAVSGALFNLSCQSVCERQCLIRRLEEVKE